MSSSSPFPVVVTCYCAVSLALAHPHKQTMRIILCCLTASNQLPRHRHYPASLLNHYAARGVDIDALKSAPVSLALHYRYTTTDNPLTAWSPTAPYGHVNHHRPPPPIIRRPIRTPTYCQLVSNNNTTHLCTPGTNLPAPPCFLHVAALLISHTMTWVLASPEQ